ncbi:MAG: hypothetical protein QMC78_04025 [Methanocellales archaeon]|nr:hypothetical protein [Methanocellales archaeon]
MVAEINEDIAGVSISAPKNNRVAKLMVFYLKEVYRGSAIGPHLLRNTIEKWIKQRVGRTIVTFASDEFDRLAPFF